MLFLTSCHETLHSVTRRLGPGPQAESGLNHFHVAKETDGGRMREGSSELTKVDIDAHRD